MEEQDFIIDQSELDDFQVQLLQKRALTGGSNNNGAGGRSMIVSGCAGSGKTILALWKTKEIQSLGFSYIFIVFTRALHQYMSKGIQYIGLEDEHFMYHHKWKEKGCPSADFIIVDEIQDFTREEISQFKKAAKKAFLFWGDSAQTIFRNLKPTQDILSIAAEAGIHPETLVFNHRLPKKIARLAAQMQCDDDLVRRCTKEGEELPRILRFNTLEEQLDAAMQQIKNRQITKAAMLFPEKSVLQKAYNYLKSKGHKIEAHIRDQSNLGYKVSDMNFSSYNTKLLTYHSAKGLQFEAVFLPECNPPEMMGVEPLYVAITRSYRYLFVMYSNKLSRHFDAIPKNLYSTSLEEARIEL
jgi:superfamily I DNA/RNA helicase